MSTASQSEQTRTVAIVRMPVEVWKAAKKSAVDQNLTVREFVIAALKAYGKTLKSAS